MGNGCYPRCLVPPILAQGHAVRHPNPYHGASLSRPAWLLCWHISLEAPCHYCIVPEQRWPHEHPNLPRGNSKLSCRLCCVPPRLLRQVCRSHQCPVDCVVLIRAYIRLYMRRRPISAAISESVGCDAVGRMSRWPAKAWTKCCLTYTLLISRLTSNDEKLGVGTLAASPVACSVSWCGSILLMRIRRATPGSHRPWGRRS